MSTELGVVGDPHGGISYVDPDVDAVLITGDLGASQRTRGKYRQAKGKGDHIKAWNVADEIRDEAENVLEHYDILNVPVYVTQGNWDGEPLPDAWWTLEDLVDQYDAVECVDDTVTDIEGCQVVGYGTDLFDTQPETMNEWNDAEGRFTDSPQSYRKKQDRLETTLEQTDKPTVLLTHNVPFDSGLDTIRAPVTGMYGRPNGSDVVTYTLEEEVSDNVIATVGGHIHEGRGRSEVQNIPVINAGENQVTYLTLEDGDVTDISFA